MLRVTRPPQRVFSNDVNSFFEDQGILFEILVVQGEVVSGPMGCPGPWVRLPDGGYRLDGRPLRVVWRRAWYLELSRHDVPGRRSLPLDGPFEEPVEAMSAAGDFLHECRTVPGVASVHGWADPLGEYPVEVAA